MGDNRLIIPEELLEPLRREREESLRKTGGPDPELVIRDEMQEWLSRPECREALAKALLRFTANRRSCQVEESDGEDW